MHSSKYIWQLFLSTISSICSNTEVLSQLEIATFSFCDRCSPKSPEGFERGQWSDFQMPVFQRARRFSRMQKKAVKLEHRPASWRRNTRRRTLQRGYIDQKQWQNWLPNKTQKDLQTAPQLYYLSIHNHRHIPKIGMKAFIDLFFCFKNDGATYSHTTAPFEDL